MRIIIESEDETSSVEVRNAGASVGDAGNDEATESVIGPDQAVLDGQTYDAGAAPAEFRVGPSASGNGNSEFIDIGGFRAR